MDQGYQNPYSKSKNKGKYEMNSKNLGYHSQVSNRAIFLPPQVQAGLEKESHLEDFIIIKQIGQGSFGTVYEVKNKMNGKIYAMKKIRKGSKYSEQMNLVKKEIKIMYLLNHPNVVKIHTHFEDQDNVYLIMELTKGGEVYDKLTSTKRKKFSENQTKKYINQLVDALEYLHTRNPPIIHRDIKAENLLLDEGDNIKLADFGWSNFGIQDKPRETFAGTLLYLAPEMVDISHKHGVEVDVWAVGILIYEFLTGSPPFYPKVMVGKTSKQLENEVKMMISKQRISFPKGFSQLARDLVQKILKNSAEDRLTLQKIRRHPFLKGGKRIAKVQPSKNPGFMDAVKKKIIVSKDHHYHKKAQDHYGFSKDELDQYDFRPESMMTKEWNMYGNQQGTPRQKPKAKVNNYTKPNYSKQQHTKVNNDKGGQNAVLQKSVQEQKQKITNLEKENKIYKDEIKDIFDSFQQKTIKCKELTLEIQRQKVRKNEIYLKKKKYKLSSMEFETQIDNLKKGIAYYIQWNDRLKLQFQNTGSSDLINSKDKQYLKLIQGIEQQNQDAFFLEKERDNLKKQVEQVDKEINQLKGQYDGDLDQLRKSQQLMNQESAQVQEIQKLQKELEQELTISRRQRQRIKILKENK